MSEKNMKVNIVIGFLVLTSCTVVRALSEEDDLELERQLKLLNKPAVKTIKTKYGDIYDCVDFYKQPGFDHPLLKNHDFHFNMKPNKLSKEGSPETEEASKRRRESGIKSVKLKGVGCPRGTVPIKRTTKEDLIRRNNFTRMYDAILRPESDFDPGLHYAGGRVRPEWMRFPIGGADAHFSLYKTPFVGQLQLSAGLIKVSNGSDFIKAGWTVNPTIYGDDQCRLFGFLHTRDRSCHDVSCPGFVLVNSDIPFGYVFPEVSITGVRAVEMRFYIYRDKVNGNWWLNLGDDDSMNIGFWPSSVFTDLQYTADDVFWGGELYSLPGIRSSPMGNGLKIEYEDPKLYAYARKISVIDDNKGELVKIEVDSEIVSDIGWDYVRPSTFFLGHDWGKTIMFGGPGGVFGK